MRLPLQRAIADRARAALADTPIVLIHGPRQAGKSTLAALLAERPTRRIVTLDDPTALAAADRDPDAFLEGLGPHALIDEVQRVPSLFRALKLAVDRTRTPGRFLLTGSTNVLLVPELANELVGRIEIVPLMPLSQGEFEGRVDSFATALFQAKSLDSAGPRRGAKSKNGSEHELDLEARITRGGFPEPALTRTDARRVDWHNAYVASLLARDVRDIARIEGPSALPRLVTALVARSATPLNAADLSRELGTPQTTLKRHLALLEAVFLLAFVPAWSPNRATRVVKAPKILPCDTGLATAVLGLVDRLRGDATMFGRLLEAFVGSELMKQASWAEGAPTLHHFRTHSGHEVDWVLEDRAGRVVGIEVKSATSVAASDFRGLDRLQELAGEKFVRGVVLHTGTTRADFGPKLSAVPVAALWAQW